MPNERAPGTERIGVQFGSLNLFDGQPQFQQESTVQESAPQHQQQRCVSSFVAMNSVADAFSVSSQLRSGGSAVPARPSAGVPAGSTAATARPAGAIPESAPAGAAPRPRRSDLVRPTPQPLPSGRNRLRQPLPRQPFPLRRTPAAAAPAGSAARGGRREQPLRSLQARRRLVAVLPAAGRPLSLACARRTGPEPPVELQLVQLASSGWTGCAVCVEPDRLRRRLRSGRSSQHGAFLFVIVSNETTDRAFVVSQGFYDQYGQVAPGSSFQNPSPLPRADDATTSASHTPAPGTPQPQPGQHQQVPGQQAHQQQQQQYPGMVPYYPYAYYQG